MLSEDNLYKSNYMQNPFDILTQENLERLEKHCKKTIHYERGNLKEEHEIILELLYRYQELEINNKNLIEKLEECAESYYTLNEDEEYVRNKDVEEFAQEILEIAKGEKE